MSSQDFEDRLTDLISEAQKDGLTYDEIISTLQLRGMALEEEEAEADD